MEDLRSAAREHVELFADLVERISAELRSGFRPAYNNFLGFFHAIDWKEPWLIGLILFHTILLLIAMMSRKNVNFQLCLSITAFSGIYLAERINGFLAKTGKPLQARIISTHMAFLSQCSGLAHSFSCQL